MYIDLVHTQKENETEEHQIKLWPLLELIQKFESDALQFTVIHPFFQMYAVKICDEYRNSFSLHVYDWVLLLCNICECHDRYDGVRWNAFQCTEKYAPDVGKPKFGENESGKWRPACFD